MHRASQTSRKEDPKLIEPFVPPEPLPKIYILFPSTEDPEQNWIIITKEHTTFT